MKKLIVCCSIVMTFNISVCFSAYDAKSCQDFVDSMQGCKGTNDVNMANGLSCKGYLGKNIKDVGTYFTGDLTQLKKNTSPYTLMRGGDTIKKTSGCVYHQSFKGMALEEQKQLCYAVYDNDTLTECSGSNGCNCECEHVKSPFIGYSILTYCVSKGGDGEYDKGISMD